MAFIIDGKPELIPGLRTESWLDNPHLRVGIGKGKDGYRRPIRDIRGIVLHTTKGIPGGADQRPQVVRPGLGPRIGAGDRCGLFWSASPEQAGAHLIVDFDGTVSCCADLMLDATDHAGPVNALTIGVEIYQGSDAELYDGQLDAVVILCDWLTRRFGIQRQFPERYAGRAIPRLAEYHGDDFIGIYGHRDVSDNRGKGDPGNAVFMKLALAGYESWDLFDREDIAAWKPRQIGLGLGVLGVADGIPGPHTVAALKVSGRAAGIWVPRPGDQSDTPSVA